MAQRWFDPALMTSNIQASYAYHRNVDNYDYGDNDAAMLNCNEFILFYEQYY